jgi:hypothetical protein
MGAKRAWMRIGMGCLGQKGMTGRWAREGIRKERQRRMQIGRRWFGYAWDLGHQRWCPLYIK